MELLVCGKIAICARLSIMRVCYLAVGKDIMPSFPSRNIRRITALLVKI